jgi:3-phosphoshikimate 1-carboxyvinyltransferase
LEKQLIYRILHPTKELKGKLKLSSSKSISNRLLILKQVGRLDIEVLNLSTSKDTQTLLNILSVINTQTVFDVGHAGTAMRFLTALFAATEGERMLTGSTRMKERPVKELVDSLRKLGADIHYTEKEGFPPLLIKGKKLSGGKIHVDSGISSQYISALLMIVPLLDSGLEIELVDTPVSKPYIEMTLRLMQEFGAHVHWTGKGISCTNDPYTATHNKYTIEADWSSASYLYSLIALSKPGSSVTIEGLNRDSLQADAVCREIFAQLGVESTFVKGGQLQLKKQDTLLSADFGYDFSDCPDIAQTLAVTTAALGMSATLTGLRTLRIKETDRILALHTELKKAGIQTTITDDSIRIIQGPLNSIPDAPFETYDDHRMALAFAPLALVSDYVEIKAPEVIEKSYPEYWDHLKQLGFRIEPASSS